MTTRATAGGAATGRSAAGQSVAHPPAPSDPSELARIIAARPRPLLLGLDVDGVLSPIVPHADDARLTPGVPAVLDRLAAPSDVDVLVISGRSLAGLAQFGFPPSIEMVGSHGGERSGIDAELDAGERAALAAVVDLVEQAVDRAGEGAWLERKPAGAVLHTRQADPELGADAARWLLDGLDELDGTIDGLTVKSGSSVVEALVRHADKGTTLREEATRVGAATTLFIGDDVTDEDAFAALGEHDISIKVGPAETVAEFRLATTDDVLALLTGLADTLA